MNSSLSEARTPLLLVEADVILGLHCWARVQSRGFFVFAMVSDRKWSDLREGFRCRSSPHPIHPHSK